jgi:hypothetical protein
MRTPLIPFAWVGLASFAIPTYLGFDHNHK